MLDIEKLMREGKTLEEIGQLVSEEMNAAQKKIDAEQEAKKAQAEKEQKLADAREFAVAALKDYFSLLLEEEVSENMIRTALESIENWMPDWDKKGKKLKIKLKAPDDVLLVADLLSDLMFK